MGTSFLLKGISVATAVVLARILNPSIFGLYALAFVAINALGLFKSMSELTELRNLGIFAIILLVIFYLMVRKFSGFK